MKTHRLIVIDGKLYFPLPTDAALLLRFYPAGDCDSCPWPMQSDFATESELRCRLARALFDERECRSNAEFSYEDRIELPDGTPFNFDAFAANSSRMQEE